LHVEHVGKIPTFFHRKLNEFNKQKQAVAKITTVKFKTIVALFKVGYKIAKCEKRSFDLRKF
jgi:hypothetical protein